MKYVVLFEDDPDRASERGKHMSAHLAFLKDHAESVQAAGPLFDGDGADGAGGLWLVDAPDAQAVQTLVETDPFWPTGLRKSVRILRWQRVFADGAVLIAQK